MINAVQPSFALQVRKPSSLSKNTPHQTLRFSGEIKGPKDTALFLGIYAVVKHPILSIIAALAVLLGSGAALGITIHNYLSKQKPPAVEKQIVSPK